MTEDKPVKAKRRRRRKRAARRDEVVYYVLEIKEWDWSFSFGINDPKYAEGLYSDHRHLQVRGDLLRPVMPKIHETELIFIPRDLADDSRSMPTNVGSIQIHRGRLTGLFSIPLDVLPSVLPMFIAERFHFVIFGGERLRYGRAAIRRFRLQQTIDEEDLPSETR